VITERELDAAEESFHRGTRSLVDLVKLSTASNSSEFPTPEPGPS
jgi:hypothetical protein